MIWITCGLYVGIVIFWKPINPDLIPFQGKAGLDQLPSYFQQIVKFYHY